MATSDIPIDITTASDGDLKFMKLYSSDTIKRIIKQQQDFERFDYDFVTGLPTKPKEMSADEWRRDAQEGLGDETRFPGPPRPTKGTLVEIVNAIRTLEAKVEQDKYMTHLRQTTYRDIDKYVNPDMFGATARPKSNHVPIFKTSSNFD